MAGKKHTGIATSTGIVVGSAGRAGSRARFRLSGLVVVLVCSVVLIGAVGYVILKNHTNSVAKKNLPVLRQGKSYSIDKLPPIISPNAQVAALQAKVAAYPKANLNSQQKTELAGLYISLGAAYQNAGQPPAAVDAYNKALALEDGASKKTLLSGLVYAYAKTGNTQAAIETLNQLIALSSQAADPSSQMDIKNYKANIERLQKGQQPQ